MFKFIKDFLFPKRYCKWRFKRQMGLYYNYYYTGCGNVWGLEKKKVYQTSFCPICGKPILFER